MLGSSDAHSFYWDAVTLAPPLSLLKESDDETVVREIKKLSVTHVLYFRNFYARDETAKRYRHVENEGLDLLWDLDGLARKNLMKVYEDRDTVLFEVQYLDNSNKV